MTTNYTTDLRYGGSGLGRYLVYLISKYWFKALLFVLALHIIYNRDVSVKVNMNDQPFTAQQMSLVPQAKNTSLSGEAPSSSGEAGRAAQSFGNLTLVLSPDYAERKGIPRRVVRQKMAILRDYLEKFRPIAEQEKAAYGIPVSITLAQGLLESNAGDSRLARESNNHFGIKCRSKCRGCTCRNYTDDDIYDMFRVFSTPAESYREHSLLLSSSRYRHLLDLDPLDYSGWAHGLKKAGYATDPHYANKLIKIIEELKLYRFDQ